MAIHQVGGSAQGEAPAQFYVGVLGKKSTVRPEQNVYFFLSFFMFLASSYGIKITDCDLEGMVSHEGL